MLRNLRMWVRCQARSSRFVVFTGIEVSFLMVALLTSPILRAQAQGNGSTRVLVHERDMETGYTGDHLPRWNGTRMVNYEGNHSATPMIHTVDRDGRRENIPFTLPEGALIHIIGIAISLDGEIAIAGSAITADKRAATFVARISADRNRQTITRTWPYCPKVVTFGPKNYIWTIGNLKDFEDTRDIALNVLRSYDEAGSQIGSSVLQVKGWHTAETSFLGSSDDRIGWFTRNQEYLEFALDASELGRYAGPEVDSERDITGVALNSNNDVIAGRFGKRGSGFMKLDRASGTWRAMDTADQYGSKSSWILGFDGATLVTLPGTGTLRRFALIQRNPRN